MSSSLPGRPGHLEEVQTPFVSDPAPNAVGGLGHRVSVEGQLVIFLHEDVVGPIEEKLL